MANMCGLLIDLDGTLIDNEHIKAMAFSKAIQDLGGISSPEIYKEVMGKSGSVIRDRFIHESGLTIDSDQYFALYKAIYETRTKWGLTAWSNAKLPIN